MLSCTWAKHQNLGEIFYLRPLNKGQWRDLNRGEVIASSHIQTQGGKQGLRYYIAGLHPRSCDFALRKISRYESYRDFISFITHSRYGQSKGEIFLRFDHKLLPYPLTLRFLIPRITSSGRYPFSFKAGILKDLQGKVQVSPHGNRCLMELTCNWQGKSTGINDTVFEIFSVTLGKLAVQKIFRISSI